MCVCVYVSLVPRHPPLSGRSVPGYSALHFQDGVRQDTGNRADQTTRRLDWGRGYVCICVCLSHTRVLVHTHIHSHARTHTHTHTHIHIHTHTHSSLVDQSCNILSQVKLVGINNSDIVDSKTTPILGLIWSIILRFQVCSYPKYFCLVYTLPESVSRSHCVTM